jgi:hypothetical protein
VSEKKDSGAEIETSADRLYKAVYELFWDAELALGSLKNNSSHWQEELGYNSSIEWSDDIRVVTEMIKKRAKYVEERTGCAIQKGETR